MELLFRFTAPPSQCGYLHDQQWSLEYEHVANISATEYLQRMRQGWRHFGHMLFRPRCPSCRACQSVRVLVDRFRPDRSQRRARQANENDLRLVIGSPSVTPQKLHLYDRFHAFQVHHKGWPSHPAKDPESYVDSFVYNPFPVEEWCYYLDSELIAVGYVDPLPEGLSAIYFYYEPSHRTRSLGTWNVLRVIEETQRRHLPHTYLGYFVAGCPSLEYKGRFAPNEILGPDGVWRPFKS